MTGWLIFTAIMSIVFLIPCILLVVRANRAKKDNKASSHRILKKYSVLTGIVAAGFALATFLQIIASARSTEPPPNSGDSTSSSSSSSSSEDPESSDPEDSNSGDNNGDELPDGAFVVDLNKIDRNRSAEIIGEKLGKDVDLSRIRFDPTSLMSMGEEVKREVRLAMAKYLGTDPETEFFSDPVSTPLYDLLDTIFADPEGWAKKSYEEKEDFLENKAKGEIDLLILSNPYYCDGLIKMWSAHPEVLAASPWLKEAETFIDNAFYNGGIETLLKGILPAGADPETYEPKISDCYMKDEYIYYALGVVEIYNSWGDYDYENPIECIPSTVYYRLLRSPDRNMTRLQRVEADTDSESYPSFIWHSRYKSGNDFMKNGTNCIDSRPEEFEPDKLPEEPEKPTPPTSSSKPPVSSTPPTSTTTTSTPTPPPSTTTTSSSIPEEPETKYKLTVYYKEQGSNKELAPSEYKGMYKEGEEVSLTAKDISGYTVVEPASVTATMPASDAHYTFFYTKDEVKKQEYVLSVKVILENRDGSVYRDEGIVHSEKHYAGDPYRIPTPVREGWVRLDAPEKYLTGNMPERDYTIVIHFGPPKDSDGDPGNDKDATPSGGDPNNSDDGSGEEQPDKPNITDYPEQDSPDNPANKPDNSAGSDQNQEVSKDPVDPDDDKSSGHNKGDSPVKGPGTNQGESVPDKNPVKPDPGTNVTPTTPSSSSNTSNPSVDTGTESSEKGGFDLPDFD